MDVTIGDVPLELLGHGARTQDQQIVLGGELPGDDIDESAEMLHAMRLAGGLGMAAAPALADRRIVSDVPRGPTVHRDVRLDPLEVDLAGLQPSDERLPGVDPDEACVTMRGGRRRGRPVPVPDERRHQRAQAGPLSVASARSA
jgi:hypothetical protein